KRQSHRSVPVPFEPCGAGCARDWIDDGVVACFLLLTMLEASRKEPSRKRRAWLTCRYAARKLVLCVESAIGVIPVARRSLDQLLSRGALADSTPGRRRPASAPRSA